MVVLVAFNFIVCFCLFGRNLWNLSPMECSTDVPAQFSFSILVLIFKPGFLGVTLVITLFNYQPIIGLRLCSNILSYSTFLVGQIQHQQYFKHKASQIIVCLWLIPQNFFFHFVQFYNFFGKEDFPSSSHGHRWKSLKSRSWLFISVFQDLPHSRLILNVGRISLFNFPFLR